MPLLLLPGLLAAADSLQDGRGARVYDAKWSSASRWRCPFYNDGRFGIDVLAGSDAAGGTWPRPLDNHYLYGAGMWVGAQVRGSQSADAVRIDTLVSFGYNPNNHASEMAPVTVAHQYHGLERTEDRIFAYPEDWPPRPREWFVTEPSIDSLVPRTSFSEQDLWCAYSDVLPDLHASPGRPLLVDVYQSVYAWSFAACQDMFFVVYNLRNSGSDTLRDCYAGIVVDPDVGQPMDDMAGLYLAQGPEFRVLDGAGGFGYVGDADNEEPAGQSWESGTPGAFGCMVIETPVGPDGEQLGMTAFKMFSRDLDPPNDRAQYLMLAGYDYRSGMYEPFDTLDMWPGDKRFLESSGPFDLAPGEVARFTVVVFAARLGGPGQSWSERVPDSLGPMVELAAQAMFIHDQGWLLPGPPLAPRLTVVPGDNNVRIVWDDAAERTPDPYWEKVARDTSKPGYDPMYVGRDLQGYVVYKSTDGDNWEIVGQFDKADCVPTGMGDDTLRLFPPGGDSTLPESLWLRMENTGIRHSLVDEAVTNGFRYYYCVASYDWNFQTTAWDTTRHPPVPMEWDTLILRSGLTSDIWAVPRWEAVNYDTATIKIVTASGDITNPGFMLKARVMVPFQVTPDIYELRFSEPVALDDDSTLYRYRLRDVRNDSTVIETDSLFYRIGDTISFALPVFNGLAVECTLRILAPDRAFDTIHIPTTCTLLVTPSGMATKGKWAFRGTNYKVVWNMSPNPTCRVYDADHNMQEVPFHLFNNADSTRDRADCWCFTGIRNNRLTPDSILNGYVKQMYICGGFMNINGGDSISGRTSQIRTGDTWTVMGFKERGTSPAYNVYHFLSTQNIARTDKAYKLNVKVVPNPYVVFDEWDKSTQQRVVRFTHLPHECTIRIFTTSGDLVKVIPHKDTRTVSDPQTGKDPQPLELGGTETWNFINNWRQMVASGVYVYHVESPVGEYVGKLVFIH